MQLKNLLAIIALTAGLFAVSASAEDNKINGYDDRPFTCGAVFRILMNNHVNDKDKQIYNRYKSIFDKLYARAKQNFIESGRTEEDARLEMQENIDFIWRASSPENPNIETIVSYCYKFAYR
jgi:hypothetical protein